jgi:FkbM family methyltransferase
MKLGEAAAFLLDKSLGVFLSREKRRSLGNYIASRASGDGNSNHATNGEQKFLERFQWIMNQQPVSTVTAIDAGANVGDWTRCFAEANGPKSKVYAFEPVKVTFERLAQNLKSWNLPGAVFPVMAALSRDDGEDAIFITNDQASELNSLHRRNTDAVGIHFRKGETVRLIKGDSFCAERSIERIDLLKIDTEGHEISVLKGFARMFEQKRIEVVQFEYGGSWLDARTQLMDAFELFGQYGYTVAKIFPEGIKLYPQYSPTLETFRYGNFLACLPQWSSRFNVIR